MTSNDETLWLKMTDFHFFSVLWIWELLLIWVLLTGVGELLISVGLAGVD